MRLYLCHHGLAVPEELDAERPLSGQGLQDVEGIAARLENAGVRAQRVLHSGKTRARQTAEQLARALMPGGTSEIQTGLAPKDPVAPIAAAIAGWSSDTALVGHLPFLGRLASLLLTEDPNRPLLAFRPGTVACLERDAEGRWSLAWMLPPEPWGAGTA
jgi:phosphohistidine phosphatase